MNWIPCKEKLPEKAGWYRVKTDTGQEIKIPYASTASGKMRWLDFNAFNPIYWQENEPPQEEPKTDKG